MNEIAKKSMELAELKSSIEEAFKTAAEAKTNMAQAQLEKEQLTELIEQLKKRLEKDQKRDIKKTSSIQSMTSASPTQWWGEDLDGIEDEEVSWYSDCERIFKLWLNSNQSKQKKS